MLSHLRGPGHQQCEANGKFSERSIITDAPADILREKKSREKERQKTLRKRCKKIRQRLSARYLDSFFVVFVDFEISISVYNLMCKNAENLIVSFFFISYRSTDYLKEKNAERDAVKKVDSHNKKRIIKSIKEIDKIINTQGSGIWANNAVMTLERNLFELIRVLEKGVNN